MKTLIINGSPRRNGNTVTLLNELKKHLSGEIFQVDTYYAKSSPCYDCRHCWTNAECIIQDEMQDVYKMMDEADNVIIASPIYFGNLTGSLLAKVRTEGCEILQWSDADGANQPSPILNMDKIIKLADILNTH